MRRQSRTNAYKCDQCFAVTPRGGSANRWQIAGRLGVWAVIAVALPSIALAETELTAEGRRIETGPKLEQISLCGRQAEVTSPSRDAQVGRTLTPRGRLLRAAPTESVSIGIMGSPGCMDVLEAVGGVIVDGRRRHKRSERQPRGTAK